VGGRRSGRSLSIFELRAQRIAQRSTARHWRVLPSSPASLATYNKHAPVILGGVANWTYLPSSCLHATLCLASDTPPSTPAHYTRARRCARLRAALPGASAHASALHTCCRHAYKPAHLRLPAHHGTVLHAPCSYITFWVYLIRHPHLALALVVSSPLDFAEHWVARFIPDLIKRLRASTAHPANTQQSVAAFLVALCARRSLHLYAPSLAHMPRAAHCAPARDPGRHQPPATTINATLHLQNTLPTAFALPATVLDARMNMARFARGMGFPWKNGRHAGTALGAVCCARLPPGAAWRASANACHYKEEAAHKKWRICMASTGIVQQFIPSQSTFGGVARGGAAGDIKRHLAALACWRRQLATWRSACGVRRRREQ